MELVKTKVGRNTRELESIRTIFGQAVNENINVISMQRWEVAPNVYRFTLSQPLPPGEYVLAEVLEDGLNLLCLGFWIGRGGGECGEAGAKKINGC